MCDRKSSKRHAGKRESRSSAGAVEGSSGGAAAGGGGGGSGGGGGVDGPTLLVDGKGLVDVVWELVISLW